VRGDEFLLLADRGQEAERVGSEAGDPDGGDCEQPRAGRGRDAQPPAQVRLAEHLEREGQPGRQLDPHPGRDGGRRRSRSRRGPRAQEQRERERGEQQSVVVRAADGEHEQDGVQAEEGGSEGRRASEALSGAGRQPDRREARQGEHDFQRPQRAGDAERREGVAREREQRSVRGVLEGPADEAGDRVARRFGREVGVGVKAVQRAHPRERDVAEDVLRDQRRAEREDRVGREHGDRDGPHAEPARRRKDREVGPADDQHQHLEAAAAEPRADPGERSRQPSRPPAAARRDVLGRRCRGVAGEHGERREQHERRHGAPEAGRVGAYGSLLYRGPSGVRRELAGRRGGLHEPILTARRPAGVHRSRYALSITSRYRGRPGGRLRAL